MFKELFLTARDVLRERGFNPTLVNYKGVISEADFLLADKKTDRPMPDELRMFFSELGDAFAFYPDSTEQSSLDGWEPIHLSDYIGHGQGFSSAINEDISNLAPRVDPAKLREEAERRRYWIPFYGFCGGGDLLCLDLCGRVQFYQALDWTQDSSLCEGFKVADSFIEFVERWSEFYFVAPQGNWTSFCWDRTGVFDWDSSHFAV
jgi:hypothetical protein